MQTVNRVILDSTTAADGAWQDVNLMTAFSVQIINLEGGVWIEASNDPNALINGANITAPAAPTVASVAATPSNSNAGTYLAKVTLVTAQAGETTGSVASASQIVAAGNTLQVTSPTQDTGGFAVGYNVYVSLNAGPYQKQNQSVLKIGVPFTLYLYQPGPAVPTANTSGSPAAGVNISGNLGALTFSAPPTLSATTSFGESQIVADNQNGNECMFSTSCLGFKYIRVRKSNAAQTKETKAYLFGQNG
jgi:hypothetical protein